MKILTRLAAIAVAFLLLSASAHADQSALSSPNTGTVSGLQLTNNLNNALNALNTCNSGASAPTNQLSGSPSLGNCWLNTSTTPYTIEYYDGASWLVVGYLDATNHVYSAALNGGYNGSVASAATTNLCSSPQPYLTISGTTTITSFGSSCPIGAIKVLNFSGALTLTYNATSLILPNNATNVVTAAGDTAVAIYLGSGNWTVLFYMRATGQQLGTSSAPVLLATLGVGSTNFANLGDTTHLTNIYAHYRIEISQCIPTSNSFLTLQMYISGSLVNTTNNYAFTNYDVIGATGQNIGNAAYIGLTNVNIYSYTNDSSSFGFVGKIFIDNPSDTTHRKVISWLGTFETGTTAQDSIIGGGRYQSGTGAMTGFLLVFNGPTNMQTCVSQIYAWN
jgi:hypothetical protein